MSDLENLQIPPFNQPNPSTSPKRILVAEDEDVTRWLATRLLEYKGHQVIAVTNGRAVLAAVEQEEFAALLLDMHLPVLGGLETAQLIRQREQLKGGHVPIIALTVEKGLPRQYWEAGLDSYLTKPLHTDDFYRTLEAVWTLQAQREQEASVLPVFDSADALQRLNHDVETLRHSADMFFGSSFHLLMAMRRALTKQDYYNLDFAARRLKGLAQNLSAAVIGELAEQLELLATTRNLPEAETTVAKLETELPRFKNAFEAVFPMSWRQTGKE